jgi:uncharacterized protein YdhG (YjbR/CyaY superfamily)
MIVILSVHGLRTADESGGTMSTTTMKTSTATPEASSGFTAEERAAMRARAKELKAATSRAEAEDAVLAAIAAMPPRDLALAERLHAVIKDAAPVLAPKTWYGMPAYAIDGKVVCYFKGADKFKTRYATFGFEEAATLDDGEMWPTCFALTELTTAVEAKIRSLLKQAVG